MSLGKLPSMMVWVCLVYVLGFVILIVIVVVIPHDFCFVFVFCFSVAESMDEEEDLIMLDNGCVCCSLRGDLVRTLGVLSKKRKQFDAILLETTGLADPAPIVYTVQTTSKLNENYYIDSIVCLADAKHLQIHLDEQKPKGTPNEALQQIAFSDKILLNKTDLVKVSEKEALKKRLSRINNFAEIIETQKSKAPLDKLLGLRSFNMESILAYDPEFFENQEGDIKYTTDMVSSVGLQFQGVLHATWFNLFMVDLLRERAADLYRTKGLLAFHGQGNTKFVFQGVHEQINFGPAKDLWKDGEEKVNKFVFIGKNLNRTELSKGLMACLYDAKKAEED